MQKPASNTIEVIDIALDDDEEDSVEVLEVEKETCPISDAKSVELSDVESIKRRRCRP